MEHFVKNSLLLACISLVLWSCKSIKTDNTRDVVAFVYQNGQTLPLYAGQSSIEVDAQPFSIRYSNKRYDSALQQFYSMRIAAFGSESQVPNIYPGIPSDSLSCFALGTGMAPAQSGNYEVLNFRPDAHHYLFYEDKSSSRVHLLSEDGDRLMLEFAIDSLGIWGHNESLSQTRMSAFNLLLYKDENLNKCIDEGEYANVTIRLKGNYRGWRQSYWNQQDSLGQTPLHRLFLLKQWADCTESQRLGIVEYVCRLPEVNLNLQDAHGNTALHYSLITYRTYDEATGRRLNKGHALSIVQALLNQGRCNVNSTNYYYGNHPLQEYLMTYEPGVNCISPRGLELIRLFLKRPDLKLNQENNIRYTAYDYAERKNWLDDENDDLIEQLKSKEGYNAGATQELWKMINQVDFNVSVLDSAFFTENIQLCIDHDANINGRQDASRPLIALCDTRYRSYGYDDQEIASNLQLRAILVNQLMSAKGGDVNAHDGEGLTALHHAMKNRDAELVKALVENRSTDLNVQNATGNTPLMEALQNLRFWSSDVEQTKACIAYLANELERTNLHVVNYKGQTLMDLLNELIDENGSRSIRPSSYPELYQLLVELDKEIAALI